MLLQDIRFACRTLAARPLFAFVGIATLALGIGANTAIFSLLSAVLLRPLDYPNAQQLVKVVGFDRAEQVAENLSPADFLDFEREASVFQRMGAHGWVGFFSVTDRNGLAERVGGINVTVGFFPTLGATFTAGRGFTDEDDLPNGPRVVVLSHGFWERRFGSDPAVVGTVVQINARPATVVGVLSSRFQHIETNPERSADVFMPFQFARANAERGGHFIRAVGRVKEGVTVAAAQAELSTIAARLEREYPSDNTNNDVLVRELRDAMVQDARPAILVLTGAVGFVLLVACANLANLLLARGASRRAELAVRRALGAGRRRLIHQLLTESVVLAVSGAVAGLLLAAMSMRLLKTLGAVGVPRVESIGLDAGVMAFTAVLAIGTGLIIGVLPALQLSREEAQATLRDTPRGESGGRLQRLHREVLIAAEVALALMLLAGAGLMLRSVWQLQQVAPGFASDHTLTFQMALPTATYEEGEQIPFYERFYEQLRAMAGVTAVGAVNILPLSTNYDSRGIQIEERPMPPGQAPGEQARSISPDYFRAMGMPLVAGRTFDERDTPDSPLVAIVSASMARTYWPGANAVGKRFTFNGGIPRDRQQDVGGPGSREIVGIVGDVKHLGLDEAEVAMFYTPQTQQPSFHTMTLVVRTTGDPTLVAAEARRQLSAMDRGIPLYQVRTLDDLLGTAVAAPRVRAQLLSLFALLALALAAAGVYGVVAYAMSQRTREIGVRLALGADRGRVLRWLLLDGLRPIMAGIVAGVTGALAAGRVLSSLLFQVAPNDAPTLATAAALLAFTAIVATWLPAWRATQIDPAVALRAD